MGIQQPVSQESSDFSSIPKDISVPFNAALNIGVVQKDARIYSEAVLALAEGKTLTPEVQEVYNDVRKKIDAHWNQQLSTTIN